jgi:hypothetical protein
MLALQRSAGQVDPAQTPMATHNVRPDNYVCYQGTQISLVYIHQCLPHPLVPRKDKAYWKFLLGTVPGESSVSEVDLDDDIDDFVTQVHISQSLTVALRKKLTYLENLWPCVDAKVLKGG